MKCLIWPYGKMNKSICEMGKVMGNVNKKAYERLYGIV